MKKLITLFVAIALVVGLSITAFASETGVGAGSYSADVNGTYVPGTTGNSTVFCVDITWSDLDFTYHAAKEPVWDPVEHKYSEYAAAYWEGEGTITVTNHSNTIIGATPAFAADTGYESAELKFSTSKLHLSSSEFMAFGENQTGTITVTAAGSLPADTDGKIGAVTVAIAEDTEVTLAEAQALQTVARRDVQIIANYAMDMLSGSEKTQLLEECTAFNMALTHQLDSEISNGNVAFNTYSRVRTEYYALQSLYNAFKAKG